MSERVFCVWRGNIKYFLFMFSPLLPYLWFNFTKVKPHFYPLPKYYPIVALLLACCTMQTDCMGVFYFKIQPQSVLLSLLPKFDSVIVSLSSSGVEVDRNLCSSSPAPEPVPCEVPCSRDCVLSDWTSWSTCSQTCSSKNIEGKQMRTRSILAYNAGEGESPPAASLLHHCVWKCMQMRPGYWLSHGLSSRPLLSLTECLDFTLVCMCICPYLKQSAYLSWWLFLLVCLLA